MNLYKFVQRQFYIHIWYCKDCRSNFILPARIFDEYFGCPICNSKNIFERHYLGE